MAPAGIPSPTFPPEIWMKIFGMLDAAGTPLLSVSLACRWFRDLSLGYVFRRVVQFTERFEKDGWFEEEDEDCVEEMTQLGETSDGGARAGRRRDIDENDIELGKRNTVPPMFLRDPPEYPESSAAWRIPGALTCKAVRRLSIRPRQDRYTLDHLPNLEYRLIAYMTRLQAVSLRHIPVSVQLLCSLACLKELEEVAFFRCTFRRGTGYNFSQGDAAHNQNFDIVAKHCRIRSAILSIVIAHDEMAYFIDYLPVLCTSSLKSLTVGPTISITPEYSDEFFAALSSQFQTQSVELDSLALHSCVIESAELIPFLRAQNSVKRLLLDVSENALQELSACFPNLEDIAGWSCTAFRQASTGFYNLIPGRPIKKLEILNMWQFDDEPGGQAERALLVRTLEAFSRSSVRPLNLQVRLFHLDSEFLELVASILPTLEEIIIHVCKRPANEVVEVCLKTGLSSLPFCKALEMLLYPHPHSLYPLTADDLAWQKRMIIELHGVRPTLQKAQFGRIAWSRLGAAEWIGYHMRDRAPALPTDSRDEKMPPMWDDGDTPLRV